LRPRAVFTRIEALRREVGGVCRLMSRTFS
jgi:hypothetical protein